MAIISPTIISTYILLIFLFLRQSTTTFGDSAAANNLYFSKTTFFPNYQNMLTSLKIFIYPPPMEQQYLLPQNINSSFSIFYNSLLSSDFLTHNPNQATLYFVPFDHMSVRSLSRHIQYIRTSYPYWNRTLGADHFYFSCQGVGAGAIRNVVELKKNAVQISCFPTPAREVVPHKDITLPPTLLLSRAPSKRVPTRFLGYWRFAETQASVGLINDLKNDVEFLIESEPSDERVFSKRIKKTKYCLFVYDNANGVVGLTEVLVKGCVPVVITDRPIKDLPLMDVIRWSEMALFVGSTVGPVELKKKLVGACESGAYERMRESGVGAAHHFAWNESLPQPYDAFYMVMYQLWLRRHAVRYSKWEIVESTTQVA